MITNNEYLYSLLLASKIINYDDNHEPRLGLDSSMAIHLFNYCSDLYFNYKTFTTCSIIADSQEFYNICLALSTEWPNITNVVFKPDYITFIYINKFKFIIYNSEDSIINNRPPLVINHNGVLFNSMHIEEIVSFSLFNYVQNKFNLKHLFEATLMMVIFNKSINKNIVLQNLLQLGVNINKVFPRLKKDINYIDFNQIYKLDFTKEECSFRINELVEYCYERH